MTVAWRSLAVGAVLVTTALTTSVPASHHPPATAAVKTVAPNHEPPPRATRSEHRKPLYRVRTSDIQPVKTKPVPPKPRPKPRPKPKPYDPYTDAPHTQRGAEQFAGSLPWPWPGIIHCESLRDESWRPSANSWARGLFQFLPSTWRSLGGTGDPADASWREQYRMAIKLRLRDGLASWDCAKILGYV